MYLYAQTFLFYLKKKKIVKFIGSVTHKLFVVLNNYERDARPQNGCGNILILARRISRNCL